MSLQVLLKGVKALSPKPDLDSVRLVTIGLSHFSEKARWGLDMAGVDYHEECHCPAMHLSSTLEGLRKISRLSTWANSERENDKYFHSLTQERHDPKSLKRKDATGVPKLVIPASFVRDNDISVSKEIADSTSSYVVAGGSSGILKFLSDVYPEQVGHLYPSGELGERVMDIEHLLDVELGNAATKWCFGNLILTGKAFSTAEGVSTNLNTKSLDVFLSNISKQDVPLVEKLLFRLLGKKFIVPLMAKYNGVTREEMTAAREKILEVFAIMDSVLAGSQSSPDRGKFLFGANQLTAADITFASLAVPILLPVQTEPLFGSLRLCDSFSSSDNAPGCSDIAALAKELRKNFQSAQYALYLYEKFRLGWAPSRTGANAVGSNDSDGKGDADNDLWLRVGDQYGEDSLNVVYKEDSLINQRFTTASRASLGGEQEAPKHTRYVYPRTKQYREQVGPGGEGRLASDTHRTMNYNSCNQKYADS